MKIFSLIIINFIVLVLSPLAYAISEADLIEVKSDMKEKCVEYYTKNSVLYCSTKALQSSEPTEDLTKFERQNIVFDERPWKFAWGKKGDNIVTIEYVPLGDDINGWKELVTSQYLTQIPPNVAPRSFAEIIVKELKSKGFDPVVTYHKVTPNEVIFEFRIEKPESQAQDEIQVIRKEDDGFYILHYVVKQFDMGSDTRKKWIDNFEKSSVRK